MVRQQQAILLDRNFYVQAALALCLFSVRTPLDFVSPWLPCRGGTDPPGVRLISEALPSYVLSWYRAPVPGLHGQLLNCSEQITG